MEEKLLLHWGNDLRLRVSVHFHRYNTTEEVSVQTTQKQNDKPHLPVTDP